MLSWTGEPSGRRHFLLLMSRASPNGRGDDYIQTLKDGDAPKPEMVTAGTTPPQQSVRYQGDTSVTRNAYPPPQKSRKSFTEPDSDQEEESCTSARDANMKLQKQKGTKKPEDAEYQNAHRQCYMAIAGTPKVKRRVRLEKGGQSGPCQPSPM